MNLPLRSRAGSLQVTLPGDCRTRQREGGRLIRRICCRDLHPGITPPTHQPSELQVGLFCSPTPLSRPGIIAPQCQPICHYQPKFSTSFVKAVSQKQLLRRNLFLQMRPLHFQSIIMSGGGGNGIFVQKGTTERFWLGEQQNTKKFAPASCLVRVAKKFTEWESAEAVCARSP